MRFLCKFLPSLGNLRPVFILKYVISAKFLLSQQNKVQKFFEFDPRDRLKRQFSIFYLFTLTIFNCLYQRSMKKPPVFITDIKSSHTFILFHKDLRSRIASSTACILSKDNLLYHNLSESKYIFDKFGEIFSFLDFSKSVAKKCSFFNFFKKGRRFVVKNFQISNLCKNVGSYKYF